MMHVFGSSLLVALALTATACAEENPAKGKDKIEWSNMVTGSWPPKDVTKIVAHRFKLPKGSQGFSFISESRVNLTALKKLSVKSSELTSAQKKKFHKAALSKDRGLSAAACYDPHHIFLLYDKEGQLINVLEVCFSCTNVRALPELEEKYWYHHDWKALAYLCEEVEIGLEGQTAEQFEEILGLRSEAKD